MISSNVYVDDLHGLALDWVVGMGAGYTLKLMKAGEALNGVKFDEPCVYRYIDNGYTEDGIKKLSRLEIFKPTQDWEQLPDDYKKSFECVDYCTIKSTSDSNSRKAWVAQIKIFDDGEFITDDLLEGSTKLEAVCRAYAVYKSVNLEDIYPEVREYLQV